MRRASHSSSRSPMPSSTGPNECTTNFRKTSFAPILGPMRTRITGAARLPVIVVVAATLALSTSSAAQTPAGTGKSFLWKVQSGTKVLYLAGSVHALGDDAYPLSSPFEAAFQASGTLVEEIDLTEAESLSAAP